MAFSDFLGGFRGEPAATEFPQIALYVVVVMESNPISRGESDERGRERANSARWSFIDPNINTSMADGGVRGGGQTDSW